MKGSFMNENLEEIINILGVLFLKSISIITENAQKGFSRMPNRGVSRMFFLRGFLKNWVV